mgnify:CR=1 FL=1
MALTNAFKEAINSGNIRRIRIMMKDSLLVDPTFREFEEMKNAASSVKGLYDIHDGKEFDMNKGNWDDNYMDKQMVQVVSNFSHERIDHIKDVVRYLRPVDKITQSRNETRNSNSKNIKTTISYKEQKRRDQQSGRYLGSKVATGAVAGAVVGSVIAPAVGVTVATGVVAGAVVGGVAVSIVSNGGR